MRGNTYKQLGVPLMNMSHVIKVNGIVREIIKTNSPNEFILEDVNRPSRLTIYSPKVAREIFTNRYGKIQSTIASI